MRNYSITTYLILINCLCLYSQADNYNNLSEYYLTYEIAANVEDENFEKNIGLCEDLIRNENYKIDRGLAACAISYVVEGDTNLLWMRPMYLRNIAGYVVIPNV